MDMKEDIQEFCGHLQGGLISLVLDNIDPDCLPTLIGLNPQLDKIISERLKP